MRQSGWSRGFGLLLVAKFDHHTSRRCWLGGVVEWLMAPVLKTGEVRASVGSNPTPSVQPIAVKPGCIRVFPLRLIASFWLVLASSVLLKLVFRVQSAQVWALVQPFDLLLGVA